MRCIRLHGLLLVVEHLLFGSGSCFEFWCWGGRWVSLQGAFWSGSPSWLVVVSEVTAGWGSLCRPCLDANPSPARSSRCATRRSSRRTKARASAWWRTRPSSRESRRPRTRSVTYVPLPAVGPTLPPPPSCPLLAGVAGTSEAGPLLPRLFWAGLGGSFLSRGKEGSGVPRRLFSVHPHLPLFHPVPTWHFYHKSTQLLGGCTGRAHVLSYSPPPLKFFSPHVSLWWVSGSRLFYRSTKVITGWQGWGGAGPPLVCLWVLILQYFRPRSASTPTSACSSFLCKNPSRLGWPAPYPLAWPSLGWGWSAVSGWGSTGHRRWVVDRGARGTCGQGMGLGFLLGRASDQPPGIWVCGEAAWGVGGTWGLEHSCEPQARDPGCGTPWHRVLGHRVAVCAQPAPSGQIVVFSV